MKVLCVFLHLEIKGTGEEENLVLWEYFRYPFSRGYFVPVNFLPKQNQFPGQIFPG